jgi:cell division protein ZapA
MAQVNLTVNGRVYRMACEDGEEDHVMQLGARFDGAIDELRGALGEIGDQRLMVMAGILMTDRLDDAERRLARFEQDLREQRSRGLDSLARYEGVEENFVAHLEAAAERLERLASRLQLAPEQPDDSAG